MSKKQPLENRSVPAFACKKKGYERPPLPPTALPFQVRTAGRISNQPWHSTLGTYHDDVMLTVMLSGRGFYRQLGRDSQPIAAEMIGIVPPEEPGLLMADPGDPYDHYYCRFNGAHAKKMATEILVAVEGRRFALRSPAMFRAAAEICRRMGNVSKRVNFEDRMTDADALLAELLVALSHAPKDEDALDARTLRNWLLEHLSLPADLDAIAKNFHVSKAHLCRIAKRELGTTIGELFESMKMEWAKVLLRDPNLRIGEIARRTGYEDPYYFSRVFRRRAGHSPRAWRERLAARPTTSSMTSKRKSEPRRKRHAEDQK